ncbi:MAG: FHA domain-containing protein [Planctomycetes bacterium]|nr:FHA domain-containing protein [Planctomycetota bacterium]
MPFLRYQHPAKGIIFIELGDEPTTIGRGRDCTVPIEDTLLSRKHCEVRRSGGQYVLVDLKSKNGTAVNAAPIATHTLKEGDVITIGNTSILFKEEKVART